MEKEKTERSYWEVPSHLYSFLALVLVLQLAELITAFIAVNYVGICINVFVSVTVGYAMIGKLTRGKKNCLFCSYVVVTVLNWIGALVLMIFMLRLKDGFLQDEDDWSDSFNTGSYSAAKVLTMVSFAMAIAKTCFSVALYRILKTDGLDDKV